MVEARKGGLDVVLDTQEKVPAQLRMYVQGVVDWKNKEVFEELVRFLKMWLTTWVGMFFMASIVPIVLAKFLYSRMYKEIFLNRKRGGGV